MEIDLLSLDWSGIMTPGIQNLPPKKDPRKEFSEVFRFPEFWPEVFPHIDLVKTLRYIAIVYDSKSPLQAAFSDIKKVKLHGAELAGFIKQEDGRFLENVELMMACKDAMVNKMIVRYVLSNKSATYSKFILYQELHAVEMGKLLSGEKGTKIAEFDLLSDKLDEVRNDLFRKDNSPDLQKEFMAFYFEERLMLRPEDIAKKLKQGDVVVTSPLKKKSRTQAAKYSQAIKKKMSIA
jgi:hypothetical protein